MLYVYWQCSIALDIASIQKLISCAMLALSSCHTDFNTKQCCSQTRAILVCVSMTYSNERLLSAAYAGMTRSLPCRRELQQSRSWYQADRQHPYAIDLAPLAPSVSESSKHWARNRWAM